MTRVLPNVSLFSIKNLRKNGLVKIGTIVGFQEILLGKIDLKSNETMITKFLSAVLKKKFIQNTSLRFPKNFSGTVTKVEISENESREPLKKDTNETTEEKILSITVYVTEKRKIQIGDKVAGRHGNKGIISKIVPYADMPYLPDGTPIDMMLNPLGIPSRMNVGQIFEGLLNLAAVNLHERYSIQPFDEIQRYKSSEVFVYNKLNEARKKTRKSWLFNLDYPGKTIIFDGRNGRLFEQRVSIGFAYILKLMHLVKDKVHARLIGPYSLVVKQPLRGKAKKGGQRFGEMEVWALEGYGAAYSLQELLTLKSDDLTNRSKVLNNLMSGFKLPEPNVPESFKVLILELQSLCFDITIFTKKNKFFH